MQTHSTAKSAILAVSIVLTFFICWEFYLRQKGNTPDFDDDSALWADKRAMVYEPADKTTVIIGSSRIKYDLDIPTWEHATGNHVVQLSMVGSSPMPFFDDLANDPKFKGRLIVDVTEILFFNSAPPYFITPNEGISYYKKRTPAQTASLLLDRGLESRLVFLNEDFFSLNALLDNLHTSDRKGFYAPLSFPLGFGTTMFDRQNKMSPQFVADTNLHNIVRGIWAGLSKIDPTPPISGKVLDAFLQSVKAKVDKIRARGGDVIFTRTPSSGPFLMGENMGFPREVYWDKLLSVTGCKGIHFADYPAIAHLQCPEFSHLTPNDAQIYTVNLVKILETDKGWKL